MNAFAHASLCVHLNIIPGFLCEPQTSGFRLAYHKLCLSEGGLQVPQKIRRATAE